MVANTKHFAKLFCFIWAHKKFFDKKGSKSSWLPLHCLAWCIWQANGKFSKFISALSLNTRALRITMKENYPAFACYRPVDDRELWLIRQCRIFYILKNPTTWRSHDPNFNWQLCASIIFSTSFNCTVYCTVYSYHRYLLFVSANSIELGFDSLAFFRLFTVSDAWFEPGLAASAVWCFTNELQLFVFARKVSFVVPLPSRTGQLDCEG